MKNPLRTILLAEDDNQHYTNFVQAVNAICPSIDIIRVDNGYSLFSMLETYIQPDVIFLDINMPYKDGLQILEELSERISKKIPIIILSSSVNDLTLKLTYNFGALFFIKKYNRPQDLTICLKEVFSSNYFITSVQPPATEFLIE